MSDQGAGASGQAELLSAGLPTASYLGVDDTGARHQGPNGYGTALGNDLFASFASTDSKRRLDYASCRVQAIGQRYNSTVSTNWTDWVTCLDQSNQPRMERLHR